MWGVVRCLDAKEWQNTQRYGRWRVGKGYTATVSGDCVAASNVMTFEGLVPQMQIWESKIEEFTKSLHEEMHSLFLHFDAE